MKPEKPQAKKITEITSNWNLIASGSEEVGAILTKSVSSSSGNTADEGITHGAEVDAAVKVNIPWIKLEFFGIELFKAEVTVSAETGMNYAEEESNAVTEQISDSSETTCEAYCAAKEGKRVSMWQFNRTAISSVQTLKMSSCSFACTFDD